MKTIPETENLLKHSYTESERIAEVFGQAVREALLEHKRAGNPVAVWQDGKVVIVLPEEIVLPPEDNETEILEERP